MSDSQEHKISITRTIHAPAEEIFAAWTDPALLEQWQAESVDFEPFVGGVFRFETSDEEETGKRHVVAGEVLAFEQDRLLVERWRYLETDEAPADSILTVTFDEKRAGTTEITLTEESEEHSDPQSRIFSIEAWTEALEELAELLE